MIDVSSEAGIAVVQMNYGKVNAMDVVFCRKLTRVLAELAADDTQAVVLTGNECVFSAGVDLKVLQGIKPKAGKIGDVFGEPARRAAQAVRECSPPNDPTI